MKPPRLTESSAASVFAPPHLSVVIPVYNEESMLPLAVPALCTSLDQLERDYEVILAENGSIDATVELAEELQRQHHSVRCVSILAANYGAALREGIRQARGRFVICEEIDLCDASFHQRALSILERDEADLVIGSKAMPHSQDERPLLRRLGTRAVNLLLRWVLDFSGTDTHGLKAFRRVALEPILESCIVDRDLFASELVVRAEREGVRVVEVPVEVREKRPPSAHLIRRAPGVILSLIRLRLALGPRRDLK